MSSKNIVVRIFFCTIPYLPYDIDKTIRITLLSLESAKRNIVRQRLKHLRWCLSFLSFLDFFVVGARAMHAMLH